MTTSVSKFCSDLFAPIRNPSVAAQPKQALDHVKDYVESTSGAWDFFRAIDYAISPWKFASFLSENRLEQVHKASSVIGSAGAALCLPTLFSDAVGLKRSIDAARLSHQCPETDPERSKKITQAYKKGVINAADFTYTLCQSTRFLNDTNLISIGSSFPTVCGVQQVAGIISDTNELVEESYKLHSYQGGSRVHTEQEKSLIESQKNLSWLKIAKNIPSIAMAALTLVSLCFASVASLPVLPIAFLGLSISWLAFKVSSVFYERIVVADRQAQVAQPV